jgi:uncharacterized SAM-binding protein YcdF (DUF218 family)
MPYRGQKSISLARFSNQRLVAALAVSFLLLLAIANFPTSLLLGLLESRFPEWRQTPSEQVAGIVLLGGFHLDAHSAAISERVAETVHLSKLYPEAQVLYSGGGIEAQRGKEILMRLGVAPERILIEDRSRSTAENAIFSKIAVAPGRSEKWLLVTSAVHMPRAMGAFRAVGFPVEAVPVDFRSSRPEVREHGYALVTLREYVALFVYWLAGQSDELFPSP